MKLIARLDTYNTTAEQSIMITYRIVVNCIHVTVEKSFIYETTWNNWLQIRAVAIRKINLFVITLKENDEKKKFLGCK